MARKHPHQAFAAVVFALGLAACSGFNDLIGGSRVDASVEQVVGSAMPALAAVAGLGEGPELTVLDHLDSAAMLERMPGSIRDAFPSGLEARPADHLSEATRSSIENAVQGRVVRYLPAQGAPRMPNDPVCAAFGGASTFIRLGVFLLLGGHGDAYLVVVEAGDDCGTPKSWVSAMLAWQADDAAGARWIVSEIIDGGASR